RYQLGLVFHEAAVTSPARALTPQGTCEAAMKFACSRLKSAANEAANFAWSSLRKPSCGGRIGGTAAPAGALAMSLATDSPRSGAKAAMYTRPPLWDRCPPQ